MLRTDGGGEYTSARFEEFLKCEGIRHEHTIPRTPEQNGVAERMNRTLVETVRSMLSYSELLQKFLGGGSVHCCIPTKQEPSESCQRDNTI